MVNDNNNIKLTDIFQRLTVPFKAEQIEWLIKNNPKTPDKNENYWANMVPYLDVRDYTERLNLIVPNHWEESYRKPVHSIMDYMPNGDNIVLTIECKLTICGISHIDYGTHSISKKAYQGLDIADKAAISDSLKRAALKFNIGLEIYRYPKLQGKVDKVGDKFYINTITKKELFQLATYIQSGRGKELPKFTNIRLFTDYQETITLEDLENELSLNTEPIIPEQTQEQRNIIARITKVYFDIKKLDTKFTHDKIPTLDALSQLAENELRELGNELIQHKQLLFDKATSNTK